MTLSQLEKRVERLEQILLDAGSAALPKRTAKWWLDHTGAFADDPGYEQMVRFGRKYRKSLRPKSPKSKR